MLASAEKAPLDSCGGDGFSPVANDPAWRDDLSAILVAAHADLAVMDATDVKGRGMRGTLRVAGVSLPRENPRQASKLSNAGGEKADTERLDATD